MLEVDPSLKFVLDGSASPILSEGFARYAKIMFAHDTAGTSRDGGGLSTLQVTVDDIDESHPQLETDESYSLSVDAAASTLKAKTVYGALRGLACEERAQRAKVRLRELGRERGRPRRGHRRQRHGGRGRDRRGHGQLFGARLFRRRVVVRVRRARPALRLPGV